MANRKPPPKKTKGSVSDKKPPTKGGIKGTIKSIKDRKALLDAL